MEMNKSRWTIISVGLMIAVIVLAVFTASRYSNLSSENDSHQNAQSGNNPVDTVRLTLPSFSMDSANPVGITRRTLLNTSIPDRPSLKVSAYEVKAGDNLFMIADKFNLKPETVLWGNYEILQDNPQFLRPGQQLNILPIDGVYYQWREEDTLQGVADIFGVLPDVILEFIGNGLDLYADDLGVEPFASGDWLIVPDGKRALKDWGPPAIVRTNPAAASYYGAGYCGSIYEGAIGTGSFIWPTVGSYISGYDYNPGIHPGIDIAGAEGNAVFASDSGVVVYSGWSEYGYGIMIVIDHGTGWQTAYAHLSAAGVSCGQSVNRGSKIGAVGNTGNSSGSHLHFEMRSEVFGKANPWNYVSP